MSLDSRRRIFVVSYLHDDRIRGGMGGFRKVLELCRQFGRKGEVVLFLPAFLDRPRGIASVAVPVIDLPILRIVSFNLLLIPIVCWKALRGRPDVIYQRIFNAFGPPLVASLLRTRLIVEVNGNPLQFYRRSNQRLRLRLVRRLLGWNLLGAAEVITLTEGLRNELAVDFKVERDRCHVVPSGSDAKFFFPRDRQECRNRLGIPLKAKVAVFAGTLYAYQGIDLLLQALCDAALQELEVWLLGEGVERRALETRAQELGLRNVHFAGQVDYATVPLYIGAADFCLAPFSADRGEVSPLKVVDYLLCGRPTVISNIPAVDNLVQQFPSCVPFGAGDAADLGRVIRSVMNENGGLLRQALSDSERARKTLSWERLGDEIWNICLPDGPGRSD